MSKIIKLVKKQDPNNPIASSIKRVTSDSNIWVTQDPKIQTLKSSNTPTFQDSNSLPFNFLLTCQSGLESLVKRECERIGVGDIRALDRLVKCRGTLQNMYELMIWSRFANRVYLSLAEEPITDFDTLHEVLRNIEWGYYLTGKEQIVIEASSTRSTLSSIPTIQSVGQNAIFSTITTPNYTNNTEVHILILIIDDIAHILLDVTGDPLHKRGYRRDAWEAPLKENLAAALVAFANWKYRTPLLDPFCGSGTIAIEAAMMARGIAPGLFRLFRIEELPFHDAESLETAKAKAEQKIYPSGEYSISASDIDPAMIHIAEGNARRAGVAGDITFSVGNFLEDSKWKIQNSKWDTLDSQSWILNLESNICIVTNPPYGNRLQSEDLADIYTKLIHEVSEHGWGFITTYPIVQNPQSAKADSSFQKGASPLANRKLLNGGEECRFWYKK